MSVHLLRAGADDHDIEPAKAVHHFIHQLAKRSPNQRRSQQASTRQEIADSVEKVG
jgi:hypothetical protein